MYWCLLYTFSVFFNLRHSFLIVASPQWLWMYLPRWDSLQVMHSFVCLPPKLICPGYGPPLFRVASMFWAHMLAHEVIKCFKCNHKKRFQWSSVSRTVPNSQEMYSQLSFFSDGKMIKIRWARVEIHYAIYALHPQQVGQKQADSPARHSPKVRATLLTHWGRPLGGE